MFKETPLVIIEDDAALIDMVDSLRDEPVIAIDTESDSFHHYREKLCLIQISDRHRDIIVDPLKVRDLSPLGELLGNASQIKVLHGADYDVVCLKRDYGFRIRNIFDTMIAAQFLGFPRIGLADLINRYFGHEVDKRFQRHDWARRPLEEEHLDYARGDTHFLLSLREVLLHKLARADRLAHVIEECLLVEEREWGGRGTSPESEFLRVRGSTSLDHQRQRVLRAVYAYRNEEARQLDRPAFKVIPEEKLFDLAVALPGSVAETEEILRAGSALARKHTQGLYEAILAGLADEAPLPDPRKIERGGRKSSSSSSSSVPIDRLLGPLKNWRNDVVRDRGLSPTVVASNQLLKEIARVAPTTPEELAAVPGIRSWQVQDFGDELLALVRHGAQPPTAAAGKRRRRRRRSAAPAE